MKTKLPVDIEIRKNTKWEQKAISKYLKTKGATVCKTMGDYTSQKVTPKGKPWN